MALNTYMRYHTTTHSLGHTHIYMDAHARTIQTNLRGVSNPPLPPFAANIATNQTTQPHNLLVKL